MKDAPVEMNGQIGIAYLPPCIADHQGEGHHDNQRYQSIRYNNSIVIPFHSTEHLQDADPLQVGCKLGHGEVEIVNDSRD